MYFEDVFKQSGNFYEATLANIKTCGIENVVKQFQAIVNGQMPDHYCDISLINTVKEELV